MNTTCGGSCTSSMAMCTVCGTIGHVHFVVRLAMYTLCGMLGRVYFIWYAWKCIPYVLRLAMYTLYGTHGCVYRVVCIVPEALSHTSYVVHTCAGAEVWFCHARSHGWKSHHLATAFTCSTYLVKCHLST